MILSGILLFALVAIFGTLLIFFIKIMLEGIFGMRGIEKRKIVMSKLEKQIFRVMKKKRF